MNKQTFIQHLPDRLFLLLKGYGWYGNFRSWEEAQAASIGYNTDTIIQKVKTSLLKVKEGEAIYERDSVLFDQIEYAWELLSALMWIAAQNKGELNLIDFGGSMGSTYYQNKMFLDKLPKVCWNIVEQSEYVKEGVELFEDDKLRFYYTIDDCYAGSSDKIHVILFSSVLQYLPYPYDILEEAIDHGAEYIIVDRTGFTLNDKERITVQKVSPKIYEATYPCRFFNEKEFLLFFNNHGYECVIDFEALDHVNIPSKYKGFIFRKKSDA